MSELSVGQQVLIGSQIFEVIGLPEDKVTFGMVYPNGQVADKFCNYPSVQCLRASVVARKIESGFIQLN